MQCFIKKNKGELSEMLDFNEEIKKFHKSTEIENLEDAIASNDLTDMNDLMFKMIKDMEKNR